MLGIAAVVPRVSNSKRGITKYFAFWCYNYSGKLHKERDLRVFLILNLRVLNWVHLSLNFEIVHEKKLRFIVQVCFNHCANLRLFKISVFNN